MTKVAWLANDFTILPGNHMVPGGCSYYRCFLPMHVCGYQGMFGLPAFDSAYGFGVRDSGDTVQFGFPVAVLKLLMERWVPKQIELAKNVGQKIVVDIDDFYPGLHESNQAFHATDPTRFKVRNREIYQRIIDMADMLVVTTPFLEEYYREVNPNTVMVRNAVAAEQFTRKWQTSKRPTIGWVGAVPWRSNDLEPLRDWLPSFLVDNNLRFHHSGVAPGAQSFAELVGIPEDRFSSSPMVPMSSYPRLFDPIDVGIVPLSDIPFNRAKSTIKGLEYVASGIPFVAQDLPEYQRLADMGVGVVASTAESWVEQLSMLIPLAIRQRYERENYAMMMADHQIHARSHEWNAMVESALVVPSKKVAA